MNREEIKKWIENNLVRYSDGHFYTGQKSTKSFQTAVKNESVKPFVVIQSPDSSKRTTPLFLKSDLEEYKYKLKRKYDKK